MGVRVKSFFAVLSVGLFAVVPNAIADTNLSGEEIKTLLSDSVVQGKTNRGQGYIVHFNADGIVRLRMADNSFSDTGKWEVDGDAYCVKWRKIRDGRRGCWTLIGNGGNEYLFKGLDGMNDTTGTVKRQ